MHMLKYFSLFHYEFQEARKGIDVKEGKERGGGRMNTKNSRGFLRMWRWPEEEEEMVMGGVRRRW